MWRKKRLPHDDNRDAGVANVLLGATEDDGILAHVDLPGDEV